MHRLAAGLAVLCAATCLPPSVLAEESASGHTSEVFLIDGRRSVIRDISFCGKTVVGDFSNADTYREGFVWSIDTGFPPLGSLGSTPIHSRALAVSADGSVVVGYAYTAEQVIGRGRNRTVIPSRREAFRWTVEDGMVSLGSLGGWSAATQVSADGKVVAGVSVNADGMAEPFRWTPDSGMVGLGIVNVTTTAFYPDHKMSADGSTISGRLWLDDTYDRRAAYIWKLDDDETEIISYPAKRHARRELEGPSLQLLSSDGTVAAGNAQNFSDVYIDVAMIWTKETGLLSIGVEELEDRDWSRSRVRGITADGSLVVGWIQQDETWEAEAFTWDWLNGITFLPKPSDEFSAASLGVSVDGSVIIGGVWPSGSENVWTEPAIWSRAFDPETKQETYDLHFLYEILRDGGVDGVDAIGDWRIWFISGDGNVVAGQIVVQGSDDIPFVAVLDVARLGDSGDDEPGDDDTSDGEPGDTGELFADVSLVDVGPGGRHMDVIASVVDADGAAVSGALVVVEVTHVSTGQVSFESGTTGGDGTVSWRYSNANADDYAAVIEYSHPDYD